MMLLAKYLTLPKRNKRMERTQIVELKKPNTHLPITRMMYEEEEPLVAPEYPTVRHLLFDKKRNILLDWYDVTPPTN